MKIAVIGAMRKEIEFLLSRLENKKQEEKLKHLFYIGTIAHKDLIIVQSGIGKVASGILFSALLHSYPDIDLVINIGVAGGVTGKVEIGEIVVGERLAYGDVDVRVAGNYAFGQIPDCPLFFPSRADLIKQCKLRTPYKVGTILSGDRFFSESEEVQVLTGSYFKSENVLALDMESAAFGQSAWFYGVPFISVRAVSDVIGKKAQYQDYLDNVERACTNSNLFLLEIIETLK